MATKTAKQRIYTWLPWFEATIEIYRKAVAFLAEVAKKEWNRLAGLDSFGQVNLLEKLTHRSKKSPSPPYDFDGKFYKFPSYFRRSAIKEALGYVSSHMTRFEKWRARPKGKAPTWNPEPRVYPTFYKGEMVKWLESGRVRLKLWNGKEWLWYEVAFEPLELERFANADLDSPSLVVKDGRAWLCIPFSRAKRLPKRSDKHPVLAVDLGYETLAVCSVMTSYGTVLGRHYIDLPREKDRLRRLAGYIAKKASQTVVLTEGFCRQNWRKARAITDYMAHKVSRELVNLARRYGCKVIVFESLRRLRLNKARGSKRIRRKPNYWVRGRIRRYTAYKARWEGIRVSYVSPKGTSSQAFDGSGEVFRFCRKRWVWLPSGKFYDADLNASYNIGARYWLRYYEKQEALSLGLSSGAEGKSSDGRGCPDGAKVSGQDGRPPLVLATLIRFLSGVAEGPQCSAEPIGAVSTETTARTSLCSA